MAKNVLITGGAGYIGSYVNKLLNESGYNTIVLDNLSTGDRRSVSKGTFIEGNFGNREDLQHVFTQYPIDAVMHFAAYISVGESVSAPAKYYVNNVTNTCTLLDAMLDHQIKTFVFSSSAAIFGNPKDHLVNEDCPKHPINPYGETKLMVEHILRDYSHAYGLRSCCLRYFNAAGGDPSGEILNFRTNQSNLIPTAIRSVINPGKPLTIFGSDYDTPDGTCIRDYIHIHDLGTAHILAMETLLKGGHTCCYNLGYGKGFSVLEVLDAIKHITGRNLEVVHGDRREGDPPQLIADSKRAQQELGWTPKYNDLNTIVRDCWNTMRHQEPCCK
jgi:UDP-glucose 4-epimerase